MANPWLKAQRKSELVDLAERVGLKNYDGLKKDLEMSLDEFLSENADRYSSDPTLAPYYSSRSRSIGSPIKREAPELKVARRRATKVPDEIVAATQSDDDDESSSGNNNGPAATSTALLARTPARALSLAQRIPLPATPADVANAVDRSALAVRQRVASLYTDSGVPETAQATRERLSTVKAVLFVVSAFELFFLRREVLADRYAFTIPALRGWTSDHPVLVPDMFLLLTSSFWRPALIWVATSSVIPGILGYFFNLSAANSGNGAAGVATRGRPRGIASAPEYAVDPLTFSVVKAVLTYVVYAQGVTFGGLADQLSVARINSALYGGWKGAIVGAGITGLMAMYEAVLRK